MNLLFKKRISGFVFIFIIILIYSCSGRISEDEIIQQRVKLYAGDDVFTCEERDSLKFFLANLKTKSKKIDSLLSNWDEGKFTLFIDEVLNKINYKETEICDPTIVNKVKAVNVYLDNTYSMAGYNNGHSEFKDALADLLSKLKSVYGQDKLFLNYINAEIFPINYKDPIEFIYNIDNKDIGRADKKNKSLYNKTELNRMFETILDSLRENQINLFITDCIFSISDTSIRTLNQLRNYLNNSVSGKLQNNQISFAIIKFNSDFTGFYTNIIGTSYEISAKRPYYLIVMSDKFLLKNLFKKIDFKKIDGFENYFIFISQKKVLVPQCELLYNTGKSGSFKQDRDNKNAIEIKDVKPGENNQLSFSIAANLSSMNYDDSYLCDTQNYHLNNGFSVEKVERTGPNNIDKKDIHNCEKIKATHIIKIKTDNFTPGKYNLTLVFKNNIPGWINLTNTNNDRDEQEVINGKTLGLKLFFEGIFEAYRNKDIIKENLFSISIILNN